MKEAKGEPWLSPTSYGAKKKAERKKKEQEGGQGTTFFTQATSGTGNQNQLFDKDWTEGGSEYDSYIASCMDSHEHSKQARMAKTPANEKNPVQVNTFVQAIKKPRPLHHKKGGARGLSTGCSRT